jgi:hypothetical protein
MFVFFQSIVNASKYPIDFAISSSKFASIAFHLASPPNPQLFFISNNVYSYLPYFLCFKDINDKQLIEHHFVIHMLQNQPRFLPNKFFPLLEFVASIHSLIFPYGNLPPLAQFH